MDVLCHFFPTREKKVTKKGREDVRGAKLKLRKWGFAVEKWDFAVEKWGFSVDKPVYKLIITFYVIILCFQLFLYVDEVMNNANF